MAKRAAQELRDGYYVNLGIGISQGPPQHHRINVCAIDAVSALGQLQLTKAINQVSLGGVAHGAQASVSSSGSRRASSA